MKRIISIVLILTVVLALLSGFAGADTIVYITKSGTKYHNDGCKHLSQSKISITLTEAINRGYTPCADCHAPTMPTTHTHTWDNGKVTTAATCAKAGVRTYTCTGCGATKTEAIPATGVHTWNSGSVTTEATCVSTGVRTYTCTVCWQKKTETIPVDANAHRWSCSEVLTAPEGDRHGYGTFLCVLCGKTKSDEICPSAAFSDVTDDWAHKGIDFAVTNGITNGTDATHFSPAATCTRGQVVTFLWRAAGRPEPAGTHNPFKDVRQSDYFCKAVLWALENNITKGMSANSFAPDQGCTRGQVVTFLWRMEGQPDTVGAANPFLDVTGDYYYTAVLWAVENGITNGTDATHFSPNGTCTRAQIVNFIYRDLK